MIENQQAVNLSFFERLEKFMYSRKFVFLVVLAGTIPMIMHSHQLFYNVSPFEGNDIWKNIYAFFYAVSFDLTILVFTIHVIKKKPKIYACFTFVMNVLYFDPITDFVSGQYIKAFTKLFLSGVLAFTSYSYAELFVGKVAENRQLEEEMAVYNDVNSGVNGSGKQDEFQCKQCDRSFPTVKALNGHMKVH